MRDGQSHRSSAVSPARRLDDGADSLEPAANPQRAGDDEKPVQQNLFTHTNRWSELAEPERAEAGEHRSYLLEQGLKSCGTDTHSRGTRYVALRCRCRSRFCPDCCEYLGIQLRDRLRERLKQFKSCYMITLTVDPELFESPEEAWEYVRAERCIARFVRGLREHKYLNDRHYFYVVEFHKNGWPHWHLLLDADYIPHAELVAFWGTFRPKHAGPVRGSRPPFGTVLFSAPKFASSDHAAHYATKYVIKSPEDGWPEWVMDYTGNIFRYSVSKGFWSATEGKASDANDAQETRAEAMAAEEDEPTEARPRRPLRERLADCGAGTNICRVVVKFDKDGLPSTGMEFVGRIGTAFVEVQRQFGMPGASAVHMDELQMRELVDQADATMLERWPQRHTAFDEWNRGCERHEHRRLVREREELPAWFR